MQSGKHLLTFLFLGLLFYSCSKEDGLIVTPFESQTPVVTGIWLTLETGPEVIGSWGSPSEHPSYSGGFNKTLGSATDVPAPNISHMDVPYPNPNQGACRIGFSLPESEKVNMWVVRGRLLNGKDNSLHFQNGAVCISSSNKPVRTILKDRETEAGFYQVQFDDLDDAGNPLPAGFYRIYFSAGKYYEYHDIFIYRESGDLPNFHN